MMSCFRCRATPSIPICCESLRSSGAGICFSSVRFMNFELIASRWCSAWERDRYVRAPVRGTHGDRRWNLAVRLVWGVWSVRRSCVVRLVDPKLSRCFGSVHPNRGENLRRRTGSRPTPAAHHRGPPPASAVQMLLSRNAASLGLREGADLRRLDVAVLEEHQGRDSPNTVLRWNRRVLVDVQLAILSRPAYSSAISPESVRSPCTDRTTRPSSRRARDPRP